MTARPTGGKQRDVPDPDIALAERLFDALAVKTRDTKGVTRASYGKGEQFAHDLVTAEARYVGQLTSVDAAGNLYVWLPGSYRSDRANIIGSHLDSVPIGGNFDGAAGVLAGLAVIVGRYKAGFRLDDDVTVMAIRAEERNWFPCSYIGARSALGILPAPALEVKRSETAEVGQRDGVPVELGQLTGSTPAVMDAKLLETLQDRRAALRDVMLCGSRCRGVRRRRQPTLMLLVCNENGSHNPDEAMDIADFSVATRVLANGLALIPEYRSDGPRT